MGQRSAIAMFLLSGGALVPLAVIAGVLGRVAFPVGVLLQIAGVACLVHAKWPELVAGHFFTFGAKRLSRSGRRLYWFGYVLIGCGLLLALLSLAGRH